MSVYRKISDKKSRSICLADLISSINCNLVKEDKTIEINRIVTDSRKVSKGDLFVAIQGDSVDGHDYIGSAIENECAAVVLEHGYEEYTANLSVPFVEVADSRKALAKISSVFYQNPTEGLVFIGITGTNGKTTTTYLVEEIVKEAGGNPGIIGTVNYRYNGQEFPAPFTTPEPEILFKLLREMNDAGVTHVVMEVSSHSLALRRIYGIFFDVAVFTNLSQDHLDFHGNMEKYFATKKMLFSKHLKSDGKAVIICQPHEETNHGGSWGRKLFDDLIQNKPDEPAKVSANQIFTCGFGSANDVSVGNFSCDLDGMVADLLLPKGKIEVSTPLVGDFNLENIIGAAGVGTALGFTNYHIEQGINKVKKIPGRLERVNESGKITVYVDYAHTPDALENVLNTLRQISSARIVVVFGCGGDRDQEKRSIMGEVAGRLADFVIITSDNSRSELTCKIMTEIEKGVAGAGKGKIESEYNDLRDVYSGYQLISSRSKAIKRAVTGAGEGDVVLIAGKGHENYQITEDGTHFFDDRQEAEKHIYQ